MPDRKRGDEHFRLLHGLAVIDVLAFRNPFWRRPAPIAVAATLSIRDRSVPRAGENAYSTFHLTVSFPYFVDVAITACRSESRPSILTSTTDGPSDRLRARLVRISSSAAWLMPSSETCTASQSPSSLSNAAVLGARP